MRHDSVNYHNLTRQITDIVEGGQVARIVGRGTCVALSPIQVVDGDGDGVEADDGDGDDDDDDDDGNDNGGGQKRVADDALAGVYCRGPPA